MVAAKHRWKTPKMSHRAPFQERFGQGERFREWETRWGACWRVGEDSGKRMDSERIARFDYNEGLATKE